MNPVHGSWFHLTVSRKQQTRVLSGIFLVAGICLFAGCGPDGPEESSLPESISGDTAPGPETNRLEGLPGEIYRSQTASRLNWQPWTKESIQLAEDSNRLILAVIALPQQPSFYDVLAELEADTSAVEQINATYVPVLIDGDAAREVGILTADLCAEIGSGLQLPLMVWLTPDVNPVAWIPLPSAQAGAITDLFTQSHSMVGRMWKEDPDYVSRNSRMDQKNRRSRMAERRDDRELSVDPAEDALRSLRQLTSLYDPVSRTFDEAGGLFPSGALDLFCLGAMMEGIPGELREKSRMVAGYLLDDLITSPMFDPLDGGAFSSRRGSTWALPGFYRDCATQARIVASLLQAYSVTGDARALDRALGVLGFIESEYSTPEGLYSLGTGRGGDTGKWLWTVDEVGAILSEEELSLWVEATGMESKGNLPSEVDPLREHFRANSIASVKFPEELAEARGTDPGVTKELLESARSKLLKVRDERMDQGTVLAEANAAATFRVVSAYAAIFSVTGDAAYLEKAVSTLEKAKTHFSNGPELVLYKGNADPSLIAGRAFLYGLALQAYLDVAATTLDESWLMSADDLATTAAELFAHGEYVKECPPDADLIGLPVSDVAMLFDESTAGLLGMAGARLAALGRPFLNTLEKNVESFPMDAVQSPILHTDVVQAAIVRAYAITYIYGPEIPAASRLALARMPLKGVNRGPEGRNPQLTVPLAADGILRIGPDNLPSPVEDLPLPGDTSLHSAPK